MKWPLEGNTMQIGKQYGAWYDWGYLANNNSNNNINSGHPGAHAFPQAENMSTVQYTERMSLSLVSWWPRLLQIVSIYNHTERMTLARLMINSTSNSLTDSLTWHYLSPPDAKDAKRRREIKHLEIPNYSSPLLLLFLLFLLAAKDSRRAVPRRHTKRCENKGPR